MIIICPGGGYEMTSDREAEPVAMQFLSKGYHVGILRYSVAPVRFPTSLIELGYSMKLIHDNKERWHVNAEQIFVQGFSAGGHLAASLGVFWNSPFLYEKLKVQPEVLKPCGLILCYPVISSEENISHRGSFLNLLGDTYEREKEGVSIEKLVTEQMPPCFIWHTFDDQSVPVENALVLMHALRRAAVPAELHIYPHGEHGLSLGDETTVKADGSKRNDSVTSWMKLLHIWLKGMTQNPCKE